jgi:hypothetical protein
MIVKKLKKIVGKLNFKNYIHTRGEGNNLHDKEHGCIKYLNCLPQENECDGKTNTRFFYCLA